MRGRPHDETSPRSTTPASAHARAAERPWRTRRVALALLAVAAVAGPLYACGSDSGSDTMGSSSGSPTSTTPTGTTTNTTPTPTGTTPTPDGSVPDGSGVDAAPDPAAAVLALGPRVVLWLDADQGYGPKGAGIVWQDRSASKNDAVQTAAAQDPSYVDAGVAGSVNGHGVVHFGGTAFLSVADNANASLHWSAGDYALYAVVRQTVPDPASAAIIYGKFAEVVPFTGPMLWANYPYGPDGQGPGITGFATRLDNAAARTTESDGGMNDGVIRLVGVHKLGNTLQLRIGGTPVSTAPDVSGFDTTGFDSTGRAAFIGGRPELDQMLQGDIAALIAVKGSITDPEQAGVETYLKTKFGL